MNKKLRELVENVDVGEKGGCGVESQEGEESWLEYTGVEERLLWTM